MVMCLRGSGLKLRAYQKKEVSYFSNKTYIVGAKRKRLIETIILSTKNIC